MEIAGKSVFIFTEGNANFSDKSPGMEIPTSANPPRHTLVYNSPALKLPATFTPQSITVAPFPNLETAMLRSSAFSIITSTVFLASKLTLTIV